MNSLLQKQIKKYLTEFKNNSVINSFLTVVNTTYNKYEEKEKLVSLQVKDQHKNLEEYTKIISHDLKSPLRNIYTLTSWFKEDYKTKLDDEGLKSLNLIADNVSKMEDIISGVLEYSAIDNATIETYEVDLHFLVEEIISCITIPKGVHLLIEDKLPTITGDRFRLQQLFKNLIINAIKYSKPEGGKISIGVKNKESFWQFFVKDEGIGIEKPYYKNIFEMFKKISSDENSTGVGLPIVQKIVSFYKGEIWLESEINKGTTFYFTLPVN